MEKIRKEVYVKPHFKHKPGKKKGVKTVPVRSHRRKKPSI